MKKFLIDKKFVVVEVLFPKHSNNIYKQNDTHGEMVRKTFLGLADLICSLQTKAMDLPD